MMEEEPKEELGEEPKEGSVVPPQSSREIKKEVASSIDSDIEQIISFESIVSQLPDSKSKDQLLEQIQILKASLVEKISKIESINTIDDIFENRRSIRKFKKESIPDEITDSLIEAARLCPSASNSQPWLFKIIKDPKIKQQVANTVFNQTFAANAPELILCCADVKNYSKQTEVGARHLEEIGVAKNDVVEAIISRNTELDQKAASDEDEYEKYALKIAANVTLASYAIQMKAHDLGLGSCWLGAMGNKKINEIFGWGKEIYPVSLLAVGYPDEGPEARPRRESSDLVVE